MSFKHKALSRIKYNFMRLTSNLRLSKSRQCLRKAVFGRHCFVLGSAPDPDLSLLRQDSILICVNGSAANANKLMLRGPDITVIDFEMVDPSVNLQKEARSVVVKNRLLHGLNLGILILTQSNNSLGGSPACLHAEYNQLFRFFRPDCCSVAREVVDCRLIQSNIRGLLSTGGLAIALSAWGGARSISFSGFSIFKSRDFIEPHFNPHLNRNLDTSIPQSNWNINSTTEGGWDVRNHSMADSALIALLAIKGINIACSHKDFAPVLHNWGLNPPNWAR